MRLTTHIKSTDKRLNILSSVIGQMSDGIWENTRSMEKYWKSLDFGTDASGYIYLEDNHGVCADVYDFFANKIKQIIKIEIDDGNTSGLRWDRNCSVSPCYMHGQVTVGDCYELYELLKCRDTTKNHYAIRRPYVVSYSDGTNTYTFTVEALHQTEAQVLAERELFKTLRVSCSQA